MRLQDISCALKAVAEVAHSGEQLVGSLDRARSRSHLVSMLVGIGVGVGLGAVMFSEPARKQVLAWLFGAPIAQPGSGRPAVDVAVQPKAAGMPREGAAQPH